MPISLFICFYTINKHSAFIEVIPRMFFYSDKAVHYAYQQLTAKLCFNPCLSALYRTDMRLAYTDYSIFYPLFASFVHLFLLSVHFLAYKQIFMLQLA